MIRICFFTIWILIFKESLGEQPTSACVKPKPFRTRFSTCANFSEICVNKDDIDCNNLLSACQDCPTPNITNIFLQDILKQNNEMKVKIENLSHKTNPLNLLNLILYVAFIVVFLNVLLVVLLLIEVRFKLITKGLEKCTGRGTKKDYRNFKSERYMIKNRHSERDEMQNMIDSQIKAFINTIDLNFKTQFENFNKLIEAKIEEKMNAFCNSTIAKIESMNNKSSGTSLLEDASTIMDRNGKKRPENIIPSEPPSNDEDDKFFSMLPVVPDN